MLKLRAPVEPEVVLGMQALFGTDPEGQWA
jgi:hypothetical protein